MIPFSVETRKRKDVKSMEVPREIPKGGGPSGLVGKKSSLRRKLNWTFSRVIIPERCIYPRVGKEESLVDQGLLGLRE